jgi:hypothetical protein
VSDNANDDDEILEGEIADDKPESDENDEGETKSEGQVARYEDADSSSNGDKSKRAPTKDEIEAWWSHQQETPARRWRRFKTPAPRTG